MSRLRIFPSTFFGSSSQKRTSFGLDPAVQCCGELAERAEHAAVQAAALQLGEPPFDLADPGGVNRGASPERSHDPDRLVRARPSIRRIHLAAAEFGGVPPAHPHADRHPAPRQHVEFGGLLGDDHRLVERREQDGGPHGRPLGHRGQRGEPGYRLGHVPADRDMTGRPQRVRPQRLENRNCRPQLRQRPGRADEAHPRPTSHDHTRYPSQLTATPRRNSKISSIIGW